MSRRVASTERIGNLRVLEPRTQESYARARFGVNGKDVRETGRERTLGSFSPAERV